MVGVLVCIVMAVKTHAGNDAQYWKTAADKQILGALQEITETAESAIFNDETGHVVVAFWKRDVPKEFVEILDEHGYHIVRQSSTERSTTLTVER